MFTESRGTLQPEIGNRQSEMGFCGTPKRFQRSARMLAVLLSILIWTSCGDTFRPVAIPVPPVPPDPEELHFVFMINSNGANNPGSVTQIDVSGDSNVGVADLGRGPAHMALLVNGSRIYSVNSLEDTVSFVQAANGGSSIGSPFTISLPAGSAPIFVTSTEIGSAYVANSGSGSVAAISIGTNAVTNTIPVGVNPIALVETPNAQKLYAVNQGSDSVTSINAVGKTVNGTIATGSSPVWAAARSDSQRVYVLNQGDGTVSVIDAFSDAILANTPVGMGANFMFYDSRLNRLYVTNPAANTVSVLDASRDQNNLLATIPVAGQPLSVTALPDGSKAYVGSLAVSGNTATLRVTVIDASNNSVRKVITAPAIDLDVTNPTGCSATRFRLSLAAGGSNSRVYVGSCDAGGAYVVRTTDDTIVTDQAGIPLVIGAPVSAFSPSVLQITGASQSGSRTTYTYNLLSGTPLRAGLIVVVTGMGDAGNNGDFAITGVAPGTFTVENPSGVAASGENANGVVQPPPQNPVFLVAGS